MKYIDADLLRKKIEKSLKNIRDYMGGVGMKYRGPRYFKAQGKESAYDALLSIIDSLQHEQPEVDLDNHTIMEEIRKCGCNPNEFDIARHFYELGKNARKEE